MNEVAKGITAHQRLITLLSQEGATYRVLLSLIHI